MEIKSLTPELVTEDISGTIKFYTEVLNLELISSYPNENPEWIKLKCGDNYIMFESRDSLGKLIPEINKKNIGGSFNIYFEVVNIDKLYERIKNTTDVIVPIINTPFKQFAIKDVNGYILLFGQHS
ncbi:MAG: VOC family protein [candidate division Zixibacteria bacterium]